MFQTAVKVVTRVVIKLNRSASVLHQREAKIDRSETQTLLKY